MLLLLLYATVGMLGLLILFVINFNYRKQTQVSQYMQCLILVHSARFLMYAVLVTLNVPATHYFLSLTDVVVGLSFPLVYLYFRNLTEHFSFDRKAALHLIIPGFFLLIIAVLNNTTTRFEKEGQMLLTVWVLVIMLFYASISFRLLYRKVWKSGLDIPGDPRQHAVMRNWTMFLFAGLCVCVLRIIGGWLQNGFLYGTVTAYSNYWIAAVIWLFIFAKLLITPQILYGYEMQMTKESELEEARHETFLLEGIWSVQPLRNISSQKDIKLHDTLKPVVERLIHRIEELLVNKQFTRHQDCSVDKIALAMNVPVSHLNYLFRYHCKESFLNLKKMIRVEDAISLLKQGYLYSHTMDSLAVEVGFTSYSSFFKSFVSITNKSPKDFVSQATLAGG